jgi:hypothetical protein
MACSGVGQTMTLDIGMGEKDLVDALGIIKKKEQLECNVLGHQIQFLHQPLLAWPSPCHSTTD